MSIKIIFTLDPCVGFK